jgi:hypothetical protein
MAPLKTPTNFKFHVFFFENDGVVSLGSTLGYIKSIVASIDVEGGYNYYSFYNWPKFKYYS